LAARTNRDKFFYATATFPTPRAAFSLPRHCNQRLRRRHLHKQKIRLHRINAPELRGRSKRRGRAARDFLRGVIQEKEVLLQTIKDRKGKYGRYLGEIWVKQGRRMVNVNDLLVTEGHAKFAEY